jgi:hypothetical protein
MQSGSQEGAGKREGTMRGETAKEVDVTCVTGETAERCEARGAAEGPPKAPSVREKAACSKSRHPPTRCARDAGVSGELPP